MAAEPRIRYGGVVAGQEEVDAVTAVLRGQEWAQGTVTAEFERAAARWQGREHALFVNSGSSALLLALASLPPRSRVAVPAVQFPTLYAAVHWCGHTPVLIDVDDSLNMDPALLERTVKVQRVDAVAFVHMAGNPSNVAEVSDICVTYGLHMIEDVCEAFGAQSGWVKAGNFSAVSVVSTHAAHHISTGEGGLVFCDDTERYRKMRRLRDWGRSQGHNDLEGYYPGYSFAELGLNLHATDIQAALGLVQLRRLPGFIEQRRRNWAWLREATDGLPYVVPRVDADCAPSWYTFALLTPWRDKLAAHLESAGIETRPIVAGNLARQPVARLGRLPQCWPVADRVFTDGLWFSVHPALTAGDLDVIAGALRSFPWS